MDEERRIVRVMLFDDSMENILLERGPSLTLFGPEIKNNENARQALTAYMESFFGLPIQQQPIWHLMRVEQFHLAKVSICIFFGKLPMRELAAAEKRGTRPCLMHSISSKSPQDLNPRLAYLVPMARFLNQVEIQNWPRP